MHYFYTVSKIICSLAYKNVPVTVAADATAYVWILSRHTVHSMQYTVYVQ